jgi:RNA polymerase-binding transcription factor DksA
MNRSEIAGYRRRLAAWRKRLTEDVSELEHDALRPTGGEASGILSDMPRHQADLAADAFVEEVALDMLGNEKFLLGELDAALDRIGSGTFGVCESCRQSISKDRLHAAPYARYCVGCEHRHETISP